MYKRPLKYTFIADLYEGTVVIHQAFWPLCDFRQIEYKYVGIKRLCDRSFIYRPTNAFYEINLVNGIEFNVYQDVRVDCCDGLC